jgi:large subunit ribosomal protein L21
MYAVVEVGARQYRVTPGEKFVVEKLGKPAGSSIDLPVLLWSDETGVIVGRPVVEGKTLKANVLGDVKGKKLVVFKYTPKKRYRVKTGHRQGYTLLQIVDESAPAAMTVEPVAQVEPVQPEPAAEPVAAVQTDWLQPDQVEVAADVQTPAPAEAVVEPAPVESTESAKAEPVQVEPAEPVKTEPSSEAKAE